MNSACTALIAEDELLLAESLRADLAVLWPELRIVAIAAHGEAALEAALRLRPQVLFLDIRMPGMTGMEVAQALAEDWPDGDQNCTPFPLLVFVTAYDQYALKAFEQAALDYVLKPVQRERLAQTCGRLQMALQQREAASSAPQRPADSGAMATVAQLRQLLSAPGVPEALGLPGAAAQPLRLLQVSVGQTIHMVPVSEVIYFEAADKYVRVVTADKEHLVRASLRELLPQLDVQQFWQVHRSVVVRTEAITRAVRDEAGRLSLHLRERPERLAVSRMFAHLFKGL
ncbi:LytR/AlgR family response regulator transcription factor [Roseateles cavernae]|uniref:LytR/AlgR family response regulator transcription factor n=1 Tax=Roseateles cavernae TaxID=3153578 RepID=UPI0032E3F047